MMLQKQWKDSARQLEECTMADAEVWALGHKVYCQRKEFWTQMWEIQMSVKKGWETLMVQLSMSEMVPHKVRNFHAWMFQMLMQRQTLVLVLHPELQVHLEGKLSLQAAWTLEPSAEETI